MADWVGVPSSSGSTDTLLGRLTRALPARSADAGDADVWRATTYLKLDDSALFSGWFGRIEVAALFNSAVEALIAALRSSIDYLAGTLADHDDGYSSRVERLRTYLELLSRLSVRASATLACEIVDLAIKTFKRGGNDYWWLYKATNNLIMRALSAIPPTDRGAQAGKMIEFPLPAENDASGLERERPEFAKAFEPQAVVIERPAEAWSKRIAVLIDWVARDRADQRHRAIQRLWLLHEKGALTEEETRRFAQAT